MICNAEVKGKEIALFSGWLERARQEFNIRLVYVIGDEEIARWIGWFCLWREIDKDSYDAQHLSEEEKEVFNDDFVGNFELMDRMRNSFEMRLMCIQRRLLLDGPLCRNLST